MYCLKLTIRGIRGDRLALNAVYEQVAMRYKLPGLDLLRQSVDTSILWPDGDYQTFYLDNLREPQDNLLFQVRTRTHQGSNDFADLFFNVENAQPYPLSTMTFSFPPRGDRGMSSFAIGLLKEFQKQQHLDLDFVFEGFFERSYYRTFKDNYTKSDKLTEFQWLEPLGRYLHVKERLQDIQEIRRGIV